MSYSWFGSGVPGVMAEPSFWPVHFRNLKLAQRGLVPEAGMVYPACSIRNGLGSSRELLPGHDLETGQLHFDDLFERRMRCAPGLRHGFSPGQPPIVSPSRSPVYGEVAECIGSLDFPQEQESTQEFKLAPRAAK